MKPDKTILADKLIEMLLQTALLILYQHKDKTHTKKKLKYSNQANHNMS